MMAKLLWFNETIAADGRYQVELLILEKACLNVQSVRCVKKLAFKSNLKKLSVHTRMRIFGLRIRMEKFGKNLQSFTLVQPQIMT